jgi:hypothetical protein
MQPDKEPFRRAVSLGNTLHWRVNLLYVLFKLSIAFVVLCRYRYSATYTEEIIMPMFFERPLRKGFCKKISA